IARRKFAALTRRGTPKRRDRSPIMSLLSDHDPADPGSDPGHDVTLRDVVEQVRQLLSAEERVLSRAGARARAGRRSRSKSRPRRCSSASASRGRRKMSQSNWAWRRSMKPNDSTLPPARAESRVVPPQELSELLARQESSWKQGKDCRVEELLAQHPSLHGH